MAVVHDGAADIDAVRPALLLLARAAWLVALAACKGL